MPSRFEYERAVRSSDLPSLSRLLALTVATWADARTGLIPARLMPSLTTLEGSTGMARASVRTHLNNLEEGGWLLRDRPTVAAARSAKARTHYKIRVPKGAAVPDSDGNELGQETTKARAGAALDDSGLGQEMPQARAGDAPVLGQEMTTTRAGAALNSSFSNPSSSFEYQYKDSPPAAETDSAPNWSDHTSTTPAAATVLSLDGDDWPDPFDTHPAPQQTAAKIPGADRFNDFWAAYPKPKAKQDALRAWLKALKTGTTADHIITAATRYTTERQGQDPKYTPYPATWLNRGSYDDEPEGRHLRAVSGDWQPYTNPADPSVYENGF